MTPAMEFRALYDAQARFVWRSLHRLGVKEAELPDALQDVFVVVHRKLPEFEGRSKLTTWLFAICIRVASDRRKLARERYEVLSEHTPVAVNAFTHDEQALLTDKNRAREMLESILERMPEEQRIVFSLFELDGMSGDDIAELLDVPVGTVRSRLRLARTTFDRAVSRLQKREALALLAPSEAR